MLILPLHRPLNRATFPFVTAVLIVLNLAIFTLFQRGDHERLAAVAEWYADSGLAQLEWPDYVQYLGKQSRSMAHGFDAEEESEKDRARILFQARLMDARLDKLLQQIAMGDQKEHADFQQRQPLLQEYQRRMDTVFSWRYLLRHDEIVPSRLIMHAFLHADISHLLGNMFFLAALGLLVEGALGEWRFALLYLLGILGSAGFSLLWHWGSAGGGLGASGAIAALMGAFCVVWGARPVRFFWWFFIAFGYVKKPAIWLLPLWVGWEAFNLFFNAGAGVGFDAHLGGLLTGAASGWLLMKAGHLREAFLDEPGDHPDMAEKLAHVRQLQGRMALAEANHHLVELDAAFPGQFEIGILRYHNASLRGASTERRLMALKVLELQASTPMQAATQAEVLAAMYPEPRQIARSDWAEGLRHNWQKLDCLTLVEAFLPRYAGASAGHWFELALGWQKQQDTEAFYRALKALQMAFPDAPEAAKAGFWLEQQNITSA